MESHTHTHSESFGEPEELKRLVVKKDGSIRIAHKNTFLTYKGHLDKEKIKVFFKELAESKNISVDVGREGEDAIYCAHEKADKSDPYEHTHVLVRYASQFRSTDARIFDYEGIHPNFKYVSSPKHLNNIWRYLAKEDLDNLWLLEKYYKPVVPLMDLVTSSRDLKDAIRKNVEKPCDVFGIERLWDFREESPMECMIEKLNGWQQRLHDRLITPCPEGDRKIVWYYDGKGFTGKCQFLKWMCKHYPRDITWFKNLGGSKDAATTLQGAIQSGWTQKIIFVDLARAHEENSSIYQPIEQFKDGMMTTTKYKGKSFSFRTPHVVIFANFKPHIGSMSLDRWEIHDITAYSYRKDEKKSVTVIVERPEEEDLFEELRDEEINTH